MHYTTFMFSDYMGSLWQDSRIFGQYCFFLQIRLIKYFAALATRRFTSSWLTVGACTHVLRCKYAMCCGRKDTSITGLVCACTYARSSHLMIDILWVLGPSSPGECTLWFVCLHFLWLGTHGIPQNTNQPNDSSFPTSWAVITEYFNFRIIL